MSTASELDLNLENLFQPAWAQGKSEANKFAKFTGNEGVKPERSYSSKPGERRAPRREGGGGERRGGPSRGGSKFGDRKGANFRGGDRRDDRREERAAPPEPLLELNVAFIPEERGVEQLARQIKVTGRAYPLFQIALLILQKAERYSVQLTKKLPGGRRDRFSFVHWMTRRGRATKMPSRTSSSIISPRFIRLNAPRRNRPRAFIRLSPNVA